MCKLPNGYFDLSVLSSISVDDCFAELIKQLFYLF